MMGDIPPPLRPEPEPEPNYSDTIYLPFLMAEAPRLQIDLLSRHTALPQAHRLALREWLVRYNARLAKYINDNYGPEAVQAANAMSIAAVKKMNEKQAELREQAERDLFTHLEQEMGRDDDE